MQSGKKSNKRKSFVMPVGMNGSNFKNEMPEMGEMAQTFISEIEWLAALKCRATGLSTSLFLTARFTDVTFTTFTARKAVNDVGGGACKIVLNNEIGFRFGNGCGRVEEQTRVTTSMNYLECFYCV